MALGYWKTITDQRASRRRLIVATGGAALAAAALAACGGSKSSEPSLSTRPADTSKRAKRGGVLKHYMPSDGASFDPSTQNTTVFQVLKMAYTPLLRYEPSVLTSPTSEIISNLAESWEFSPDRLQLTLKLRPGVKWHNKAPVNGRTFDMDDVLFSVQRTMRIGSGRAEIFAAVNPQAPVISVTAADSTTLVIKLNRPIYYAPGIFANNVGGTINIIPKETDSTFDIRRDMIGTGPYVLTSYESSIGYKFKRNEEFFDKSGGWIDEVEFPILPEYASAIAQFKRGNIYAYDVKAEDVLSLKREVPALTLYQTDFFSGASADSRTLTTGFGWLPEDKSPFLDERVRQAYSLSLDRELWLDVVLNLAAFRDEGLPVETKWNSAVRTEHEGWLDPRSKEFGLNTKYFQHDLTEAKKLMAAAGYANGLDFISTVPAGTPYGVDYMRQVELTEGMAREAGFRTTIRQVDFTAEFLPKYRSSQGKYEGWAHKTTVGLNSEAVSRMYSNFNSRAGGNFLGFSVNGKSDGSGDPYVDTQLDKAMLEIDREKRNAIGNDVQRYLAKTQYELKWPGTATGFQLAWPVLKNFEVVKTLAGNPRPDQFYWWLDDTQPPLKKS